MAGSYGSSYSFFHGFQKDLFKKFQSIKSTEKMYLSPVGQLKEAHRAYIKINTR